MGLWNFISSFFRDAPEKTPPPGETSAELSDRGIFVYWDGQKKRYGDPIEIIRKLRDDPEFVFDRHMEEIKEEDLDAIGIAARAVRRAFDIPTLAEGGLTEAECVGILASNADFGAMLKKNGSGPPISLPTVSDSTLSLDSAAMPKEECPTNVSSASL